MPLSPLAGLPPPPELLIDPYRLVREFATRVPDLSDPMQLVSFGTSGHRGTPMDGSFTEAHILAITQAICEHRSSQGITGPLFLAMDTHAVDAPAHDTALEVLAGHGVDVMIARGGEFTPIPVLSHAILSYNRGRTSGWSDGIAVTPSHNPPRDGGFKYNPPHGGPADAAVTGWIQDRANDLLRQGAGVITRIPRERALAATTTHRHDFIGPYIEDLATVIMEVIRSSGLRIAVDPLGGAGVHLWAPLRERYRLDLTVVNPEVDPTFRFVRVDHDGQIRMDCSSPYAMAGLVALKDRFQIAFGNDTDADRHGIVAPSKGLLPANHMLAVACRYLFSQRPGWPTRAMVGKSVVTSAIIDRVAGQAGRALFEVPVGFKWFVAGLRDGSLGFAGEESAGASFLRRNGSVWTTDKDGPVMGLLACELTARTGKDPGEHYAEIEREVGQSFLRRDDRPANPTQKAALTGLVPSAVRGTDLAGDPITSVLTTAPGNGAPIGGLKVVTSRGWFAARPSGTEPIYKIYAESLVSESHLDAITTAAQEVVEKALAGAGADSQNQTGP